PTVLPGATVPGATVACVAACVECTKQLGPGLYALSRSPHMVQCRSLVEYFRTGLRVAPPGRVPATTRDLLLCAGPSKVLTAPREVGRSGWAAHRPHEDDPRRAGGRGRAAIFDTR